MRIFTLSVLSAALLTLSGSAFSQGTADRLDGVSTYKETAVFNQVVGDTRFVGAFQAGPNRCDVTVFQAAADDRLLAGPLRRMVLPIAAGARGLLGAGSGSGAALAIACTARADAIKVAPQMHLAERAIGEN